MYWTRCVHNRGSIICNDDPSFSHFSRAFYGGYFMLMPDEINNPRRGTSPRKFRINIIPMCPQLFLSFRSGGMICFRRLLQPSKIIIKICPWSVNCTDRRPSSSGGCSNPLCTHFGPYGQIGKVRRQNIARGSVVSWHASEWRIAPSVPHLDVYFIYILFAALGAFWVGLYSLGWLADWLTGCSNLASSAQRTTNQGTRVRKDTMS